MWEAVTHGPVRTVAAPISAILLLLSATASSQESVPCEGEDCPENEQAGPEEPELASAPDLELELPEPEDGWISMNRYVAGGITGSTLSFGTGHIVVGEWTNFGWVYTVSQALGVGLVASWGALDCDDDEGQQCADPDRWDPMLVAGLVLLGVSWVAEKIDLWVRPRDRVRRGEPEGVRAAWKLTGGHDPEIETIALDIEGSRAVWSVEVDCSLIYLTILLRSAQKIFDANPGLQTIEIRGSGAVIDESSIEGKTTVLKWTPNVLKWTLDRAEALELNMDDLREIEPWPGTHLLETYRPWIHPECRYCSDI